MEHTLSTPTFSKAELKASPPKHPRPIPGINKVNRGKFVAVPVAEAAPVLAATKSLKLEPLPEIQAKLPPLPKALQSSIIRIPLPKIIQVTPKPPLHPREPAQIDVFSQRWHKVDGRMTPLHKGARNVAKD